MSAPEEIQLDVGWGQLSALRWGPKDGRKILCLHGWMDNAASFQPLAGALPDAQLVAIDFAGHGRSDHRPEAARYYLTDYFFDLDAALDALGWTHCVLLGHSMGTALTTAYATANPGRVDSLIMLDGMGQVTEPPERAAGRLARSLQSVRNPRTHPRVFPSVADAGRARQLKNPMSDESAQLLAERALKKCAGGWRWRTDPRAMWESPYWMTEPQSSAILHGVQCPALAVITPMLESYLGAGLPLRIAALKNLQLIKVDGGHHVHMDSPGLFARPIEAFLGNEDFQHD